jgi:ribosomal protein S18 acetylase RimI-like enzyme
MNILLKRATAKDIKSILALEKVADAKTYSARTNEEEVRDCLKNEFPFLIKKRETVVGIVVYKIKRKKTVGINGLVIDPKFRGRGFARQAILLILKKVRKYPRIELVVHPHNVSALSLYLSLGFIIESWQDNHFGDGEPRLVMVKK